MAAEREGQGGPLLWGGCFLILLLVAWFWAGGFSLPNPLGVKVLQAIGAVNLESPRVMWEYLVGEGDMAILCWDKDGFSPDSRQEGSGKVIALDPAGKELWRREMPGEVFLKARGFNWATGDPAQGEATLYRADGRLAWQQRWSWPLQDIILSSGGEVAVLLGPLREEGTNLIEKVVLVNEQGQARWEYPVRNGTILDCRFDPVGDYLVVSELLFHKGDLQHRAVILDRQGRIGGEYSSSREEFFTATTIAAGQENWFLAGAETLYSLHYSGEKDWQYNFGRIPQRVIPEPVRGGVLVITLENGSPGAGSILSYLDREGELIWEHRFSAPAAAMEVMATAGGILVGDGRGIYGLDYGGKIIWYHPVPGLAGLAADQEGGKILVYSGWGRLTLLELP
jgi:hypothetical protein